MDDIRTLFIRFNQEIPKSKISAFRGAIVEKVGREHVLFHQHKNDRQLLYHYPLIQYKSVDKKASIFCIGGGVAEIHKLFGQTNWDIDLQGTPVSLNVDQLDLNSFKFQVSEGQETYELRNWIGLNAKNYKTYQRASGLRKRIEILERVLTGNILSMAKGLDWHIEKQIEIEIQNIKRTKPINLKGTPLMSFDLELRCNVALPNHIGLGKSASHGFGSIQRKNKN